jgi:DnaJ-class molecular chaperone
MATQIGFIKDFETVVTTDSTCRKCNGLGKIKSFKPLPDGGVCYRCNGLGVCGKDYRIITKEVPTMSALKVEFLEDGDTFEDMLAKRQAEKDHVKACINKFNETGSLYDLLGMSPA